MQELDWFYKSYEWPAKIAKVMKEASSKVATDHKSFEQSLKARRKEFGDSLGDLESRVAAFSQYDVIARRAEHATEVCSCFCLVSSTIHALLIRNPVRHSHTTFYHVKAVASTFTFS
jgi:hypothetical protein